MSTRAGYMRDYRAGNPAVREADRARAAERYRALETPRERHQEEFDRILAGIRSARPQRPAGRPRAAETAEREP